MTEEQVTKFSELTRDIQEYRSFADNARSDLKEAMNRYEGILTDLILAENELKEFERDPSKYLQINN